MWQSRGVCPIALHRRVIKLNCESELNRKRSAFVGEATMRSIAISLVTFAVVCGGALLGVALRAVLPPNHFSDESKDAVKLGMGLIATMAALVLGLLIASAKSSFDTQNSELTEMSSRITLLIACWPITGRKRRKRAMSCAAP